MVIDSSALLAILFGEPEADAFIEALAAPDRKFMSAMNKLEAMIVVEARKGASGASSLIKLLAAADIEIIPFDSGQSEIAMSAWRQYGRGRHPAGLNLGDCAAYALASTLNEPLLFKGGDFSKTDIATATPSPK
jgi:ribonuclease VapC